MSPTQPRTSGDREELLNAILQTVADAILIVDANGMVRYANSASAHIFGRPPEQIIDHQFGLPIVSGETTEVDIVHRDGRHVIAELRISNLMLDGQAGYVASIRDITARKRAAEHANELLLEQVARTQAEENERRARFLAECANVLGSSLDYTVVLSDLARVCVEHWADWCVIDILEETDDVTRVAVASRDPASADRARRLRETEPETAPLPEEPEVLRTGQPALVGDFLDAGHDERYCKLVEEMQASSAIIAPLVSRRKTLGAIAFINCDRTRSYCEVDLDIIQEIGRYAATAVDNSRLFQEADRGNQAKSNFLAIMSHELRTPLNAVIGYADLLSIGIPAPIPQPAIRHVDRIRASARHLLNFIDEILTFSRSERGRARLELTETTVRDIALRVATLAEPLARERDLKFILDLPEPDYAIRTDTARLQQILLNLLSNAVKFTPSGKVELCITRHDDWTHFSVIDTGIGIPAEFVDQIFEPFWQVEQTRTRSAEGAGLGLSLAKRLADSLGAELGVESAAGVGSTFSLRLPNRLGAIRLAGRPNRSAAHPADRESKIGGTPRSDGDDAVAP